MKSLEMQPTHENVYETLIHGQIGRTDDVFRFVEFLNSIDGSFSVALDGRWGSGKTFFVKQVKMVLDSYNDHTASILTEEQKEEINRTAGSSQVFAGKQVEIESQVTVYYDAWSNDNDDDPLLSIIYEILTSLGVTYDISDMANIAEVAAGIFDAVTGRNTLSLLGALKTKDPLKAIKEQKSLQEKINDYINEAINERGNRLVVFVDELDRCRPDYAVRLLERIKHYFSNDRVTFVFSINGLALQHTIRKHYGEGFDASRYTDRFFDLTMELPKIKKDYFLNSIGINSTGYDLLKQFQDKYPEWFEEKKTPGDIFVPEAELRKLKPMPFMAMVSSVSSNDPEEMYNYLGGVQNSKRSEELDAAFKQDYSNFRIVIVVDMWITGFDVPSLTYMYNDKPLQKHQLIQTISRVNRKYPGKSQGLIVDYIGIRDNMRVALKQYGGDNSVAPSADDIEQATFVFREELSILKDLFAGYDLRPFLNPEGDPAERYRLLAKAAEFVFVSTQELQSESKNGKSVKTVSFKTYFLKTVKRMRSAFDICQPSGELGEDESALAQCFMAIAGFVRKMSGASEVDTETMNRRVAKMVAEALKYNKVESVLEEGEQEDIFSPEYFEKLSDVKMPASKLELLVKMLRKQITEYGKTNQMAAKRFQEMLEETIKQYHERRKHLTAEEAGEAQEQASEEIIRDATEQALRILRDMNADRESFRKIGLTFEEKAFYDILMALRDQYNFEYGEDKTIDGVTVNDKCKSLAKKIKEIIDTKSSFADWLNNQIVRDQLKFDIKICLVKNGYPPQYSPEVFRKVMEQVENFEENN